MLRGRILGALVVALALGLAGTAEAASTAFVTIGTDFKRIDMGSGAVTPIGSLSSGADPMEGLAMSSGGTLYGVGGGAMNPSLFSVDKTTGASTSTSGLGQPSTTLASGLAYDSSGVLWMSATYYPPMDSAVSTPYRIDTGPPTATPVGSGTADYLSGLAGACDGTLYGAAQASFAAGWRLVSVNTTTGALTTIGPLGGSGPANMSDVDLAMDHATGTLWAVEYPAGNFFTVNKNTGTATGAAFPAVSGINGITIDSSAQCPPPASGGGPSSPAPAPPASAKKCKKKAKKRAAPARKCKKRKRR